MLCRLYIKDGGIASPRKNGYTKQSRNTHQGNLYFPTKEKKAMEGLLIDLWDFAIEKVVSLTHPVFEARRTGKNTSALRMRKATHQGLIPAEYL